MPINPGGTAPGLAAASKEEPPKINMKCKRPECSSNVAIEVKHPGSPAGRRLYQCCVCRTSWGINTGGPVDL